MTYYLTFDLPTSVNKMYNRTRRGVRLSDEARTYKEYAALMARNQWEGEPLEGALSVTYRFFGSRADWDNNLKVANDALNGIVWVDDKYIMEAHVYMVNRKDVNPRMEIEVCKIGEK